jgi:hypothetical protein
MMFCAYSAKPDTIVNALKIALSQPCERFVQSLRHEPKPHVLFPKEYYGNHLTESVTF